MFEYAVLLTSFLSILFSPFVNGKRYARLSTLFVGVSFLISLYVLFAAKGEVHIHLLRFDGLGSLLTAYILFVSLVIHKYSINYMKDETGFKRFFVLLDLLTFVLLLLVLSDNTLLLFTSWHLMGVILYLLLTHNHKRYEAIYFGKTALFTHRLADIPLLLAILILYKLYGTFSISELLEITQRTPAQELWIVTLLVVLSALIKSAQIPFHFWLVYSMEGPTPVSAIMHAGIVNAGAFLVNRFSFLFPHDQYGLSISFLVGIVTAILGSMLMLMQNDVKKALGYSTVGQMGYMMMEIGVGAFALAVYHMITHGIFKATLFLSSGGVIHEARKDTNIPRDEVYDALVKKEIHHKEIPVILYIIITVFVPLLLVLITHFAFEKDIFKYKAPLVLLFFGWVTSAQILLNLFKVGREKPFLTAFAGAISLLALLSVYVLAGQLLQTWIYPYENLQTMIFERAFSNIPVFFAGIILSLILVLSGWVLIYYADKEKPIRLHLSLYAHLSRELYFPDIYRLVGESFHKLARAVSVATIGAMPMYAFYSVGNISKGFPFEVILLALFVPIFPISLLTSYLIRNYGLYPLILAMGFITLQVFDIPSWGFFYALAGFTMFLHSLRAISSQTFKDMTAELYPALVSMVWIVGKEHFIITAIASLFVYLLGIYLKKVFGNASFEYAGGFIEKMPIFSLLLILVSLYACLIPPMPTFYTLFEALLKVSVLPLLLLILGWFLFGVAITNSLCRLLYGKPREDIYYIDILWRK